MTQLRIGVSRLAGSLRLVVVAAATLLVGTTLAVPSVATEEPPRPAAAVDEPRLLMERPDDAGAATDVGTNDLPSPWSYYTLQLNLCNSGKAACYDQNQGQSVPEAIDLINEKHPDLVTLNEVCWNDVQYDLYPAMRDYWDHEWVFAVFQPAYEPYDGGVWPPPTKKCSNGEDYGIGMIGRSFTSINDDPPNAGVYGTAYPETVQVPNKEWRSWLCVDIVDTQWTCTTHLTSEDALYALEQCHYLMDTILPNLQDSWGYLPSIVGGDLNLHYPSVQMCVPDGWWRKGDDDVQHIMYTDEFEFLFTEAHEMEYTDHPGWLVAASTP